MLKINNYKHKMCLQDNIIIYSILSSVVSVQHLKSPNQSFINESSITKIKQCTYVNYCETCLFLVNEFIKRRLI